MRIEREMMPRSTLEEFANNNNLTMVIRERHPETVKSISVPPLYAKFKGADIAETGLLRSAYGNGYTEAEAIMNYVKEISGKRLKIGKEYIDVPLLKD